MNTFHPYHHVRSAWMTLVQAMGPWAAGFLVFLLAALSMAANLVPVGVVGLMIALLVHHWRSIRRPDASVWTAPLPWLALYFLLHVLAMAWTEDIDFGLFDLQIKAPLLAVPLVAMLIPVLSCPTRNAALFIGFMVNALAVIICMLAVVVRIAVGSEFEVTQEVFSARFSFLVHPSYFAMYLCLSLAAWVLTPMHTWLPTWYGRFVLLILCIGIVLSGSKLGWIMLALVLPFALVLRWHDRDLRATLLGMGAISAFGLGLLIAMSPYARDRVQEAWRTAFAETVVEDAGTSSAVRVITWSAAKELIMADPWTGTGTGDIKNELLRIYAERGQSYALEHRLNAHSQFLQSAACLGILGGMLLVILLFAPLFGTWRRDPLVLVFLVICALNWSVESMLEVQAGVVWTATMVLLLFRVRSTDTLRS